LSLNGRRIAYVDAEFDRLYVIDRNGRHRRLVVRNGGAPRWSPNGRQLVYADAYGAKALKIVDLATHRIRTLPTDPVFPGAADWSPDGRTIVFAGTESEDLDASSEIYVIGSNGSGLRNAGPRPNRCLARRAALVAGQASPVYLAPVLDHLLLRREGGWGPAQTADPNRRRTGQLVEGWNPHRLRRHGDPPSRSPERESAEDRSAAVSPQ